MVQQRLLEIAIEEFGRHGLDGASTRQIAKAAGTAMSSITYHYGGKEGLYLAAADYVASQIGDIGAADEFAEILSSEDAAGARAGIQTLIARFIDRMRERAADSWTLFILREQMNPTEAFERIYAGSMGEQMTVTVRLIQVATGTKDVQTAQLTAITLLGQALVMKAARATCRKVLERETLSAALMEDYAARVAANIDAILDRMIAERQEQA